MTSRRDFLRTVAVTAATAAAGSTARVAEAASEPRHAPPDAVGMLYDATRCIGCKTCVVACHEANDLPPDTSGYGDGLYDAPTDVNERTKNVIRLYRDEDEQSFVKKQCMHCIDPACAGACMIGALQKREFGIVSWDPDRCIGCRYCGIACPFEVPRFEWSSNNPKIVKCEMCRHRLAEGRIPACCEVCPREAVIFGTYEEMLVTAQKRLEQHPERYVPKIYGEHDGGGTQVLYLAGVEFAKLGLPDLGPEGPATLNRRIQHGIYQGFVAPIALYAALGAVLLRNRRHGEKEEVGHE